jgi:hypothetical protein
VLFRVFDYFLGHDFALKTTQSAFDRFTLINSNYSHSFYAFLLNSVYLKLFNTRGTLLVKQRPIAISDFRLGVNPKPIRIHNYKLNPATKALAGFAVQSAKD